MPRDVADLWGFITGLDHASVMALFAHCASQTVNAVKVPWERKPRALETADKLASALALDMTAHWTPTVRTYLGRVTKALILDAVREAVSGEAADRIASMKKQPMAEAAEQLLVPGSIVHAGMPVSVWPSEPVMRVSIIVPRILPPAIV